MTNYAVAQYASYGSFRTQIMQCLSIIAATQRK